MLYDPTELLARCEGDVDLAKALVTVFQDDRPRMLDQLRNSVAAGDAPATYRAAHALKGSLGTFGDKATEDSALALEQMGRDGQLVGAPTELAKLEREITRLEQGLTAFANQTGIS